MSFKLFNKKRIFFGDKKARVAIPLTIGFILFNVIIGIMVTAFAMDSTTQSIGSTGSTILTIDNTSTDSDISVTNADGWLSGFKSTLNELPWWLNTLFVVFETSIFALIIYALIRGL